MRRLLVVVATIAVLTACQESGAWQVDAATAIGDELAPRMQPTLARAATVADDDIDAEDLLGVALDQAIDEMPMPDLVSRIVVGSRSSETYGEGFAALAYPLVVVPKGDGGSMFCMRFAMSTTGVLIAEPAVGTPMERCGDVETRLPTRP